DDLDAERAEAHRGLHRALQGAAEGDPALELLRDVLRDELRVDLRLADLDDVQADVALGHPAELLTKLLDVGALLADHHARPGGMDRHPSLLRRTLDHDPAHTRLLEAAEQMIADLQVLVQQVAVL